MVLREEGEMEVTREVEEVEGGVVEMVVLEALDLEGKEGEESDDSKYRIAGLSLLLQND